MGATKGSERARRRRWVTAAPSEYLIKLRGGKVVRSGPGLSVFLWPGETCAVLPTSIQQTAFVADQITAEKVGVAVSGLAVYRIAEPLLAFRMLDFERGGLGVLASTLREMFVGAARRLVAGMTVEECLTRRKESIAAELMREIRPVVSGQGRPQDATDRGWGVVIDTIEIQDVRILSERVFAHMQAPFRSKLELLARSAAVSRDQEVHLREAEAERSGLEVQAELGRRRGEAEEVARLSALAREERVHLAELEGKERLARGQLETDLAARARALEIAEAEHGLAARRAEQASALAMAQAEARAELERRRAAAEAELARAAAEERVALERLEAEAAAELVARRAETRRVEGEVEALLLRASREVENHYSDERIRYELVAHALPALARAFAETAGPVHLTQVTTDGGGTTGLLARGLAEVLATVRAAGIDPAALLPGGSTTEPRSPASSPDQARG